MVVPLNDWNSQLLQLLEYRVVLGAVVTTLDGLVVAQAGLTADDAELLAATLSAGGWQANSERGAIHALVGSEMRLIVVTDRDAPPEAISELLADRLTNFEEALAA
jgi:predicted regulator of Ras-like GTPase activity (Roadblock/LC7/MglB family)